MHIHSESEASQSIGTPLGVQSLAWGPDVQYNIAGQLNRHPRAAMQFRASEDRDKYIDFYDQVVSDR